MKDPSKPTETKIGPHPTGIINKFPGTMKNPSKPTETKIGPRLMGTINKFPDLKEQWDATSAAYDEALRMHEQWCELISTPLTLAFSRLILPRRI